MYERRTCDKSFSEISLGEYLAHLYKNKLILFVSVMIFSVTGILIALSLPNQYKSEATMVPTESESASSLSSLASKFGGVASLAGIDLGAQESNTTVVALKTLESRVFINAFIRKYDLAVPLMAVDYWDHEQDRLVYDDDLYSEREGTWIRDVSYPLTVEPSEEELYEEFRSRLSVLQDDETGFVSISFTHYSPKLAQKYLELLIKELNIWVGKRVDAETTRRIKHLKGQIQNNDFSDLNTVFFSLLTEEYKNKLLYQLGEEFAFKTLDPPTKPQFKDGPMRALICIAFAMLGFLIGAIIASFRKIK